MSPSLGGGFGQPGAVNAMLVAMLYFLPGSMKVDDPETKLPAWLLPSYNDIFAILLLPSPVSTQLVSSFDENSFMPQ